MPVFEAKNRFLALSAKNLHSNWGEIIERNLTATNYCISAENFAAAGTPKERRTHEQQENGIIQLADALIEELQKADCIIIGAPVYNFGPPASLKTWADLVARAGTTFRYRENGPQGLLQGKKAYIIAVRWRANKFGYGFHVTLVKILPRLYWYH